LSEQVMQYFQVSLANLQTTYLDYVVLHSPLASQQQTMEIGQAMEKLVISDGVKRLGISNCYDLDSLAMLYLLPKSIRPSSRTAFMPIRVMTALAGIFAETSESFTKVFGH